jgi:hypothetical protein
MALLFAGAGLALILAAIFAKDVKLAGNELPAPTTTIGRAGGVVLGSVLILVGLGLGGVLPPVDGGDGSPSPSASVAQVSADPSATTPATVAPTPSGASTEPTSTPLVSPTPTTTPTHPVTPKPKQPDGPWRGMPAAFNGGIDAALKRDNGRIYLFDGSRYVRFSSEPDGANPGYPVTTSANFRGMPGAFQDSIDAATSNSTGQIYFFRGDRYIRFTDLSQGMESGYPVLISGNWKGMPSSFNSGIDAALTDASGRIYFFKDDQFVRFSDVSAGMDAGYPQPIASVWVGLPPTWRGIDAAVMTANGDTYFFKDGEYVRFASGSTTVDQGYPRPIGS